MLPRLDVASARNWRAGATNRLTSILLVAANEQVPAYPDWTIRDLVGHVIRIYTTAAIALRTGRIARPTVASDSTKHQRTNALAERVHASLRDAETALESCPHDLVWGAGSARRPYFWQRRLLREAVLHRWDGEQAIGDVRNPDPRQALVLIDEFIETDVTRAIRQTSQDRTGRVSICASDVNWTVDLTEGTVGRRIGPITESGEALIAGEPPALWLWLMRRNIPLGDLRFEDPDGSATAFAELIDGFRRPDS